MMDFAFDATTEELRSLIRRVAERRATPGQIDEAMRLPTGYDPATWTELVELGLCGVLVGEEYGGVGLGPIAMGGLCEVLGATLLASPYFAHAVLAADLLSRSDAESLKMAVLPRWARGERLASLAYCSPGGSWCVANRQAIATPEGTGWKLDGHWEYVPHGADADDLIVAAVDPEGATVLLLVRADEVVAQSIETLDQTRRQARLTVTGLRLGGERLIGHGVGAAQLLETSLDRARASLAWEQIGGATTCLMQAVDYAKTRQQFGLPIGTFQAIKHLLADAYAELEIGRAAAFDAIWAAQEEPELLSAAAGRAKTLASQAFFSAAGQNIQVHGGIGFTWEHPAHLYFKRARSSMSLLGAPDELRRRTAAALGLQEFA
jgi:alkylation response protein AidB-like acyl-CoA dehydrogenase